MDPQRLAGLLLLLLAVAHSGLGEARVLRALVEAGGVPGMSPQFSGRLLRMAWHATSLAWVGIAVLLFGGSWSLALGIAAGIPAVVSIVGLRSHLAWPLFLTVALAGLRADGHLGDDVLALGGVAAIVLAGAAGVMHLYWSAGGRAGAALAIPTRADSSTTESAGAALFIPPPVATAAVGVALAGYSGAIGLVLADVGPSVVGWLVAAGVVVLTVRAIGDGRYVGFSKQVRGTAFAQADDRFFTPIVVALTLGSIAALLA